jgi:predicted nucleic acid-binding protein
MKLLDTIVLIAVANPESEAHDRAVEYLDSLGNRAEDTFLPMTTLIEFDLVMKGRKYTSGQRRTVFSWLSHLVLENKIISNSSSSLGIAVELQEKGLSYFDSMISALAIEKNATILTSDKMISQVAETKW